MFPHVYIWLLLPFFQNCIKTGDNLYNIRIGGIAGYNEGTSILNCENAGNITAAAATTNVGGICGRAAAFASLVKESINNGEITIISATNAYVGGIIGWQFNSGRVISSVNAGNITLENVDYTELRRISRMSNVWFNC